MNDYQQFLANKMPHPKPDGIKFLGAKPAHLFDFQQSCVEWALMRGRAALFLDTGLGKSRCQLEFCKQTAHYESAPSLLLTPLAVARQIEQEAINLGYDARVIREKTDNLAQINICNYDRLDKLDTSKFCCVSLDESAILKNFSGSTSRALISAFAQTRFRLCATATPAPNDHVELGTHAEFLGIMSRQEMLVRWFINDTGDTKTWRLKRHGEAAFWDWVASWARMAETPADLGFDASRYVLPKMHVVRHKAIGSNVKPMKDGLFAADVSATNMFDVKRQTIDARAAKVAEIIAQEPHETWCIWCDTNDESDKLAKIIADSMELRGSQSVDQKEFVLNSFSNGNCKRLITKSSLTAQGLNWQHCARTIFVGRKFSYQDWYQSVRRFYRFGQKREVVVHLIVAEGEDQIGRVIDRKAADHDKMRKQMAAATRRQNEQSSGVKVAYEPKHEVRVASWMTA